LKYFGYLDLPEFNMVSPEITKGLMKKVILLNIAGWALALGAFGLAMFLSYRQIHYNIPNDLRTPAVLLVNALLATASIWICPA